MYDYSILLLKILLYMSTNTVSDTVNCSMFTVFDTLFNYFIPALIFYTDSDMIKIK